MKYNRKFYENYLTSEKWNFKRHHIAELNNYKCQICGKKIKKGYHIHHITYEHLGDELDSELMFLCPVCHLQKIHKQFKSKKNIKKEKIVSRQFTQEEKDMFLNDIYYKRNFDKLNTKEKSIISTYVWRYKKNKHKPKNKLKEIKRNTEHYIKNRDTNYNKDKKTPTIKELFNL